MVLKDTITHSGHRSTRLQDYNFSRTETKLGGHYSTRICSEINLAAVRMPEGHGGVDGEECGRVEEH